MEKVVEIQKQARDNSANLQSYITDLKNWEAEMKRKESALNGDVEQELPPVRSKLKKEKPVVAPKKPAPRIKAHDYDAWNKFDADKVCEEVDMEDKGPTSLDSKKSMKDKEDKLREEAQYEKEKGNNFVKLSKWQDAISCYTRAIQLYSFDAIYYANRALGYLKIDNPTSAERDCTKALELDPQYVKALQRRASARWKLGSLKAAAADAKAALQIEPGNRDALDILDKLNKQMGTKGPKTKSSPTSPKPKSSFSTSNINQDSSQHILEEWGGSGDHSQLVEPIEKPALHLRSKVPLKKIPIREVQLGEQSFIDGKTSSRLKIIEIEDDGDKITKSHDQIAKSDNQSTKEISNAPFKGCLSQKGHKEQTEKENKCDKSTKVENTQPINIIPQKEIDTKTQNLEKINIKSDETKLPKKVEEVIPAKVDTKHLIANDTQTNVENMPQKVSDTKIHDLEKMDINFDDSKLPIKHEEIFSAKMDTTRIANNTTNEEIIPQIISDTKTYDLEKMAINFDKTMIPNKVEGTENELMKLNDDIFSKEYLNINVKDLKSPTTSVQFMLDWKLLRGEANADYLKLIDPDKIANLFRNSMESQILSEILMTLWNYHKSFDSVKRYLVGLSKVPRLSALVMFMGSNDKKVIKDLLEFCSSMEGAEEELLTDLKSKFEIF